MRERQTDKMKWRNVSGRYSVCMREREREREKRRMGKGEEREIMNETGVTETEGTEKGKERSKSNKRAAGARERGMAQEK